MLKYSKREMAEKLILRKVRLSWRNQSWMLVAKWRSVRILVRHGPTILAIRLFKLIPTRRQTICISTWISDMRAVCKRVICNWSRRPLLGQLLHRRLMISGMASEATLDLRLSLGSLPCPARGRAVALAFLFTVELRRQKRTKDPERAGIVAVAPSREEPREMVTSLEGGPRFQATSIRARPRQLLTQAMASRTCRTLSQAIRGMEPNKSS